MTPKPFLLPLVAALLMAAPVFAAPTHTGTWTASAKESQLQLSLRMKGEPGSQMGFSEPLTAFQGLSTADGSTAPFRMTREAGTFTFEGRFSGGEGAGHFQFEPNESYAKAMAGLGYPKLSSEDPFKLALFDISTSRIKELAALGYKDIPLKTLFEVGIFDVTPEYIQALAALGYTKLPLKDLVAFRIHGVSPEFVREIRGMGFPSISQDDLMAFRIHGVTPAFIREMREAGYTNATADDLVKLRIHGIDREFVRSFSGSKGK
ncbi:hypothetical protein [Hyalangium minutum]|uniref:4-hydroxy-3-methylbut-2-enyl diphosphate reductase n=1 Tax=Hyalangium minutum TaxID=394096 RepID=A0A085WL15_9BACT|nr:hypothetical protein [Hyalangium minutum]KFE68378.1 hypothetical protein DB31_7615 [Hyalangium minutum]